MNTILYFAQVFTRSGDFLGNVAAFDIDNFNIVFISEYNAEYYCNAEYKTKISFPNISEKEVFDIVSKHGIIPMKSSVDNYKELLEKLIKNILNLQDTKMKILKLKIKKLFLNLLIIINLLLVFSV